ncbi:MAG: AAA family ATPase, partial [Chloroflexi bacterium]|nr:AAA family ATPase [Chloroflexota bacterium]
SQASLAERANLSVAAVAALESGKRTAPYPRTLDALAEALGLPARDRAALVALAGALRRSTPAPLPGLPESAPPIASTAELPVWLTSFVGRDAELQALHALLVPPSAGARLVTLIGPGGVGKTRLAVAAAAGLRAAYPDGVAFVDLAPLREARLVAASIARTLGLRQAGGRHGYETLLAHLRARRMLVVLDNFEQVLDAAPLLPELLRWCPQLTLLVTSRRALRVQGERRVLVPPLANVPDGPAASLTTVAAAPAVQLFVQRAQAVSSDLALDASNAASVAGICRQLDGIPLAIELAAARVVLFRPEALLRRLERRLPVLTGGPVDLPERQQTLSATLAWSHDLLEPAEQLLFRRLAVFAGGWTLEAAEAVCADGDLPATDILGCLDGLLDSSLVRRVTPAPVEQRFDMLETVRDYAHERLVESGELASCLQRHAAWYTALAVQAPPDLVGPDATRWYDQLDAETDNLRLALDWPLQTDTPGDDELRLATGLARLWRTRGRFEDALGALEAVCSRRRTAPSAGRIQALTMLGHLEADRGELTRGRQCGCEAVRLAEALGDATWIAYAQVYLGITLTLSGSPAARGLLEAAVANARAGARGQLPSALLHLAQQLVLDEPSTARALLQEAAALSRNTGDAPTGSIALGFLAMLALRDGREAEAQTLADEVASIAGQVGFHDGEMLAQMVKGGLDLVHGAYDQARARYLRALRGFWREGHLLSSATMLEQCACLEAQAGATELAAHLAGAVDGFCASHSVVLPPIWRTWWFAEPAGVRARARSGEQPLATAWAEGRVMLLADAVALVASPAC